MALANGKYFTVEEMRCRDKTPYPEKWALRLAVLFSQLDVIRERYGSPLVVVSGYRTPEHNAGRGVSGSQHLEGRAVDLRPYFKGRKATEHDIEALHVVVNTLIYEGKLPAVGGVGFYRFVKSPNGPVPGWVHVDTRPRHEASHRIARWVGDDLGSERTG